MILWELATRERPWSQIEEQQYIRFFAALSQALESGERPAIPDEVLAAEPGFVGVMQRCWTTDPGSRPSFSTVVHELSEAKA